MSLITWTDDLSVGVRRLDDDHKILIGLINKLYDAMSDGHGDELLASVLSALKKYTATHFFREESLMKSYDYPDYEDHKKHHESLINRLNDFVARYNKNKNTVNTIEISRFLQDWLLNHIKQEDFQYKPHFHECGLT